MKVTLNPSVQAIKTLFFQWTIENFLMPEIADFEEHINLIVLRNHLLDFALAPTANESVFLNNLQFNQKFHYVAHIDKVDFDVLRSSFSDKRYSENQLVINIGDTKNRINEILEYYVAFKSQLGIKHLLVLANGFDQETSHLYGIKEINLNDFALSNSSIDKFISSLVSQTNLLFYGLNRRTTVLEFAYNLHNYEIGDVLKNSYCGFLFLFDFYSRNGYLPDNLYDGYHSYMNFVLQYLLKILNPTHESVTYSREMLIRFFHRAAMLSQYINGSWVIQLHQLISEGIEFDLFEQIKYKSPLWKTSNNQVFWSDNNLHDYWVSDYLAGKTTGSDSDIEIIFSHSHGFNNLSLAFLIAKITRRLLRPHLAIEILTKYLAHNPAQHNEIVYNCVEIAGANILGWKRISEKLRRPISSVENQDVSSLIGVL